MMFLLRGMLTGLVFGVPVGAVGVMTIQRTYVRGFRAGLVSGLGSSAADCLYAAVGAFGLTAVSDLLLAWQRSIRLLGGAVILAMGIVMLRSKAASPAETRADAPGDGAFFSSLVVGLTNPAAILTFLLAFSTVGIKVRAAVDGCLLVAGVLIGTLLWWAALSGAVVLLRRKAGVRLLPALRRVCGLLLMIFGGVMMLQKG